MNSNNDRLEEHVDHKTGKRFVSTTDASGKHTLTVDADNGHLLKNTSWWVAPIRKGSPKLVARACSKAPRIAKGAQLHRKAIRNLPSHRQVRALDGNLLNATRANLQSVLRRDMVVLGKTRPANKLIGVRFAPPPKWLKSPHHWHARIKVAGHHVHLGSFKSSDEAGCAFDGAARRLYGQSAVTNRSLGLISERVARTKVCRRAARAGKRKVVERLNETAMQKLAVFDANPTSENFVAMATRPEVQTSAVVRSFANAVA